MIYANQYILIFHFCVKSHPLISHKSGEIRNFRSYNYLIIRYENFFIQPFIYIPSAI